jgi:hypothetical protein
MDATTVAVDLAKDVFEVVTQIAAHHPVAMRLQNDPRRGRTDGDWPWSVRSIIFTPFDGGANSRVGWG